MILNYINSKMPIYKDCTLGEMIFVGAMAFLSMLIIFSLLTWILIGYWFIGVILSVLSLVHVTRFLLSRLQKMKFGKPYGYYQQKIIKSLSQNMFFKKIIPFPYLQRIGKWSVRRRT